MRNRDMVKGSNHNSGECEMKNTEEINLTLNLLTTTIVAPPSNASKWQMGFNSAFKGLNCKAFELYSEGNWLLSELERRIKRARFL